MLKNLLRIALILLAYTGCVKDELPEKILISGDYSGSLDYLWSEEINGGFQQIRAASYPDSSSITYPAFYFVINTQYAILQVRKEEKSAMDYYYAIQPSFTYTKEELEVRGLKMIFGTGLVNNEIQNPDDSRTLLLEGKLKRL